MKSQQATSRNRSLALMLILLVVLLVGLPVLLLLITLAPSDSAEWVERHRLLLDGNLQQSWLYTLTVALAACTIASMIAIPTAFVAVRSDPLIRGMLVTFGVLPLAMPAFATAGLARDLVGGNGLMALASMLPEPIEPRDLLLILVYAWHFLPLILLSLIAGLSRIDRKLSETAANLGAGSFLIWRRIILPLTTPSFILGAGLMALKIIEDVGTPLILGVDQMLAPQILSQLRETSVADHLLANQVLLLLLMAVLITALAWPALLPNGNNGGPIDTTRWSRHPLSFSFAFGLTVSIAALAVAPYIWLLNKARDINIDWSTLTSSFGSTIGLSNTLIAALAGGMLLMLLGGLSIASTRYQGWQGRLARLATGAVFALPGVILAIAYQHLQPWIGGFAGFAWIALVLTVTFKHLPLVTHLFVNRLVSTPAKPTEMTHNFEWTTRIGLWLRTHAAIIAGLLIFGITAMLFELSAALVLITHEPPPLAMALFQELQNPGGPIATTTLTLWLGLAIFIGLGSTLALARPNPRTGQRQTKKRAADKPPMAESPS